ncbi:MAG: thiamine diphosphokinase [Anaerolineales bacterium]
MIAAIFANGVIENAERAREAADRASLVLAANGGALHCLRLEIAPAFVIGDLDSLDESDRQTLEADGTEFITHPPDKDQTDLELALLAAVARGATEITVLGAIGGRMDMTLANVQLLALLELSGIQVEVWHGDQTASIIRPPGGPIEGGIGDGISLIPIGGNVPEITTRDLQYALNGETLDLGPSRGVSNVISGPNPRVELGSGSLLIVHTPSPLTEA